VHRSKSTGSLDRFDLERGSQTGSAIAALFNIYMGAAIEATHKELDKDQTLGVQSTPDPSGKGRNFSFKSMAGCASEKMYDILYADDMQILAHTPEALQDMLNAYDAVPVSLWDGNLTNEDESDGLSTLEPVTWCQHQPRPRIPPHKHQYNQPNSW
jgi:hypothetical protein